MPIAALFFHDFGWTPIRGSGIIVPAFVQRAGHPRFWAELRPPAVALSPSSDVEPDASRQRDTESVDRIDLSVCWSVHRRTLSLANTRHHSFSRQRDGALAAERAHTLRNRDLWRTPSYRDAPPPRK
jgi:hypothetical protein